MQETSTIWLSMWHSRAKRGDSALCGKEIVRWYEENGANTETLLYMLAYALDEVNKPDS